MKEQKLVVIVVVLLVAISSTGAFFLMNKESSHRGDYVTDSDYDRLLVFGNVNNDNYLDERDMTMLKSMVDKSYKDWTLKDHPYADVNTDGRVDSDDIALLEKFLKGESATMYYVDWNLDINKVPYPLEGNVAVPYDSSLWIGQIVGFYENITYMARDQDFVKSLRGDLFPGAAERIEAQGGDQKNYDVERLIKANIKIALGDSNALPSPTISKLEKAGISAILLPNNREHNGLNWSNTVITLGVMMNKQENTKEYIEYLEEVSTKIQSAVEKATQTQERKSYLLIYCDPWEEKWHVDIRGSVSEILGDVATCEKLPLYSAMKPEGDGYVETNVENILAIDPDVIIFSTWGPFMQNQTIDDYKNLVKKKLDFLKETKAYKSQKCYQISYEVYGTLPGISGLVYLGSQIWPSLFDKSEGLKYLQDYFDKFTKIKGTDVKNVTGLLPLTFEDLVNL